MTRPRLLTALTLATALLADGALAQMPTARVVGKGACRDDKPHTPSLTGDGAS